MYKIIRKGKKLPKSLDTLFKSYEAARSAARKWLRKNGLTVIRDRGWIFHNNPSISDYGFSVKKV